MFNNDNALNTYNKPEDHLYFSFPTCACAGNDIMARQYLHGHDLNTANRQIVFKSFKKVSGKQ